MGIKVVLSDKEAASKPFELLPRGWYKAVITDGEVKECGPDSKNPGKPYYSIEVTISEGKYEGRKLFDNLMCFEGALYSIVQLCNATGFDTEAGDFEIPELEEFMEKEVYVSVGKQNERTVGDKTYGERNEVKGYKPATGAAPAGKTGSLLPS